MAIDRVYNYDNTWIRSVSIALIKTLHQRVRWINRFEEGGTNNTGLKRRVLCPFYLTIPGDERFVIDAFVDDIRGDRVELNTDQIPRAAVTFTSAAPTSSEFANPNQYLSQQSHINGEIRNIVSKVKAVPITLNYEIEMRIANERDTELAWQKTIDALFNYFFFRIDYYGMAIDCALMLPDDLGIEIPREIGMDSDRNKVLKYSLQIKSYYPIFKINVDDLEVCDNDDDIDWERLGVPQPTEDYYETLRAYFVNDGQPEYNGIQKVFWKSYLYKLSEEESQASQYDPSKPHPRTWRKINL